MFHVVLVVLVGASPSFAQRRVAPDIALKKMASPTVSLDGASRVEEPAPATPVSSGDARVARAAAKHRRALERCVGRDNTGRLAVSLSFAANGRVSMFHIDGEVGASTVRCLRAALERLVVPRSAGESPTFTFQLAEGATAQAPSSPSPEGWEGLE